MAVRRFKGEHLAGLITEHPFYDRPSPVVLGRHVTLDAGTGAVHIAPGHGREDYDMGLEYGLEIDPYPKWSQHRHQSQCRSLKGFYFPQQQ